MQLLLRWIIAAVALYAADALIAEIYVDAAENQWVLYAVMAVVFAVVNGVLRPILKLLSLPLLIVTLGLFALVINAVAFWFSSWVAVNLLEVGFHVDGFVAALLGSIVVSVVSTVLNAVLVDDDD